MLFLFTLFIFGNMFAEANVELDVVFSDSTVQCKYLYVLGANTGDTLAVFDTLSFNRQNRVSLFYTANKGGKNILLLVDSEGALSESKPYNIMYSNVFSVAVGKEQISVNKRDFLYFRKNSDNKSYFVFLLFFFTVKSLITFFFVFLSALHRRVAAFASGAFLLSALIDWFFPLHYFYRLFVTLLAEYLFIAILGRKSISWLWTAILVMVVNFVSFGIIAFLFILHALW